MFVISLTYTTELSNVEHYLQDHLEYLDKNYKKGIFLISGGKVPRTGGIILAHISNRSQLDEILSADPFKIHNVADYEIIEFIPTKTSPELAIFCT